ncbi:MAG: DUF1015 domain-containing protein [Candidatus Rokubacteria bacterium]|nr:DUF1015 domain-containing protein [Candidatus Rokubacteria bacterium]
MRIQPFHGYRYANVGRDVSSVVAPPYDQIGPATQERLYQMSPWNVVRVTYPKDEADKYRRARETLDRLLAEGVWQRDDRPAIYPYHQTYRVGGETVTRMGFVALGEVTPYGDGVVLPHERTHAGPKKDRLELLEATGADMGLLFMLVGDPAGDVLRATAPTGDPIAEARDLKGEIHRLWKITEAAAVTRVQALMASRPVIIADGHHRYETAVEYATHHAGARHKMMAFCTLEAPGLTIFPNHRLVHGVRDFDAGRFLEAAQPWFDVAPLADPAAFRATNRTIGVVTPARAATLTLRDAAFDAIPWPAGTSRAWRSLAVSILHEGLLKPWLDITDEKLDAKTHVDYTAEQSDAIAKGRGGRYQAAFLIAAATPDELRTVVRGGELMPQKSTHFYPKLLDGLVFHRLDVIATSGRSCG